MMRRSATAIMCSWLLLSTACDPNSGPAPISSASSSSAAASPLTSAGPSTAAALPHSAPTTSPHSTAASAHSAAAPPSVSAALAKESLAQLAFVKHGKTLRALNKKALAESMRLETVAAYDPYYNKPKQFLALPLRKVLAAGFAEQEDDLVQHHYVLKALDGYTVPISGKRLLEDGGYIAIADIDTPQWQPIGPQQANPAPYYLIWRHEHQHDLTTHPRPWQLASIAIARFEDTFPHTAPGEQPQDSAAWRGYRLFSEQCIRCHAINREGGRVGPELNVPQNIVEYRPIEQIRAYIRNPLTFRYGNMPQNPHLSDADLDDLVAYLTAMKTRKHDPNKAGGGH